MAPSPALSGFHPALRAWFERRFPEGPSPPQEAGWPAIRAGADTLIASPTGSGKTLAGFLTAIDACYRAHESGELRLPGTRVVYVSPLKALAVDIEQNLTAPLREIARVARELGAEGPELSVRVRSGDTSPSGRQAMLKAPPTFLVTTPESLFLMLTAAGSRATLGGVTTVIVDEIHALARDRRGAHLALSLERLEHLQGGGRPQRIGLSATQRPLPVIADLLSGVGPGRRTTVVDCGHQRHLDLRLELPGSELAAVASLPQLDEMLDRIAELVRAQRTTLVFVNTRRLAERFAHLLGLRLGAEAVAAHHGSLSRERRQLVEARLRQGALRALVATASLELGIDIGPVEMVCQVGSPRSIATLLQRVGRANHSRGGTPVGRLFPQTRDELVECTALLAAIRAGELDAVLPAVAPLDVLAQQVVAEVAAEPWDESALQRLVGRAAPYAGLTDRDFAEVLELVCEGVHTGRGARGAHLHRDRVGRRVKGRRGARLAALTGGGAIPDSGDYRVVADPDDTFVGSVNEDFAIESMPGDVFLLGTHSWRIRRVEAGQVRVVDAAGATPTVPFWLGEAPSRTDELSTWVSRLRRRVDRALTGGDQDRAQDRAVAELDEWSGVGRDAAAQLVRYLAAARTVLGVLPSRRDIVFERFFDVTGSTQLVVHAPLGGRINRALGLALRKRLCTTFDFELQAAASDDAVVLSLGAQHGFPLEVAPRLLRSQSAGAALTQAVLATPLFRARWRWNLTRSLVVARARGGRRTPIAIQRMEADDCMAAVFPQLAACQENAPAGPIPLVDHVLVRQTLRDCLHDAMDLDGLCELLRGIEAGEVRVHLVEPTEPSVLAHEILTSRPYTFLDDAPLEERRTRQVRTRRELPSGLDQPGRLDPAAIARVTAQARPDPRGPDELHDLLAQLVVSPPEPRWAGWFEALVAAGRAQLAWGEEGRCGDAPRWCVAERRPLVEALLVGSRFDPDHPVPAGIDPTPPPVELAAADAVRGHLDRGPASVEELERRIGVERSILDAALARLQSQGWVAPGPRRPRAGGPPGDREWCARHLLARMHAATVDRRRRQLEPVTAQDLIRFLLRWQHVLPGTQLVGRQGLLAVVDQLQGFPAAAGSWEPALLAARVQGYRPEWLDDLCLGGEVVWGRLGLRAGRGDASEGRGALSPSRATPLTLARRCDLGWLMRAVRGGDRPDAPRHGAAREILDLLDRRGALFHRELETGTGRLPAEVEEGLWALVAGGLVTADGFQAVRALLSARENWRRRRHPRGATDARPEAAARPGREGRWVRLPEPETVSDADDLAEAVAGQLLSRWGVVFWELAGREDLAIPWREVVRALRRLEARGVVRGGRFVSGFVGEQYARPEAVEQLRLARRVGGDPDPVRLSGSDPLNLLGIILPGARVPAVRTAEVVLYDRVSAPA